jgi:hypothetical protein
MKHIFARKVELAYTGTLGTKILSIIDSFHSIMPLWDTIQKEQLVTLQSALVVESKD